MATYRAAYVLPEAGSNGVGVLLTTEEQSTLTDDELMMVARQVAAANDVEGEIVIGDWRE
ncbi:hypothetical protein QCE47_27195 [Caballeronia sp. LZ025]|jgi:dihydrodipicolinate synthase/N-acetylneuraminate lyase|uniref:hypothetical protein n=1 Tax=Caballeronia TaxID=1827195 RepID=UPI001FD59F6D|nr:MULTISPECIES: hypothetical protein [Caballeronia]MDR5736005.1 hypothetical protein [Caballeronia sp. LZ025]